MMKKTLRFLPAILAFALLLTACDTDGSVQIGNSLSTDAPGTSLPPVTTSQSALSSALPATESPAVTTAPISYPVLYEKPEVNVTHENVVPAPEFDSVESYEIDPPAYADLSLEDLLKSLENHNYLIGLATPTQLPSESSLLRLSIDYVYVRHYDPELKNPEVLEQNLVDLGRVPYSESRIKQSTLFYSPGEIPLTTTGGKYLILVEFGEFGESHHPIFEESCILEEINSVILTWELDMDSVPGSTGKNWNRPPYIGHADAYYAFGFGDVWESYQS